MQALLFCNSAFLQDWLPAAVARCGRATALPCLAFPLPCCQRLTPLDVVLQAAATRAVRPGSSSRQAAICRENCTAPIFDYRKKRAGTLLCTHTLFQKQGNCESLD